MPWGVAAAAVAAGGSMAASSKASKAQKAGADGATALQREMYGETAQRNALYEEAGGNALRQLTHRLPGLTADYDPSKLMSSPGYQFGLDQGQQALERSMAARGRGVSGAALKAASQFGTDYGTTKLNDAFARDQQGKQQTYNQLMGLVGTGQASANNTAAAGQQFASQAGANMMGAANASAANSLAQGNIFGGLVNQGASAYGRYQQGQTNNYNAAVGAGAGQVNPSGGTWQSGAGGGGVDGTDQLAWLADGGAVRREPRIGSRTPLPGSGGAMSREAVLAALDQAVTRRAPPEPGSMAALPANPVTNPRAILDGRMRAAGEYADGGEVDGPGGPRDDRVPAMLSDGEHVIDAATVTALGDGDNEKGQAILDELRARVKAHAKPARKRGSHGRH